jgi:two-component system phosphate regulon sensor histidine kinase PhoR
MKVQDYFSMFITLAILMGLFCASILALLIVRNITKSLNEMTNLSSEIAGGRYDKRISINTNDEIGELARSFNNMAEKLEITISDLSDKNNKLEAILKSMTSGVIAVDNIGKIMLVNPVALEIFGFEGNIVGKHILEVIRNVELEDVINKHQDEEKEISLNYPEKRVLRVKATPIKGRNEKKKGFGVVAVLQDITELKRLEQIRSDFVANVSHELKTPLTSIKGFAETLKDGAINDDAARGKFLDIINIEADRLTRLINDLLTISELENTRQRKSLEKINMNDSINDIRDMMNGIAWQKNIELLFHEDEKLPYVYGSHDKVKQLLINLIDNGIKYTHDGGKVDIRTYHDKGYVYIDVTDTGIGIPKEHLPRLFERFYRVDKGRSRALGGTGLGLAIVKHIVAAIDGDIKVRSEQGIGTTFTVIIPEAR